MHCASTAPEFLGDLGARFALEHRWRSKAAFLKKYGESRVQMGTGPELSVFPDGSRSTSIGHFVRRFGDAAEIAKDEMVFEFAKPVAESLPGEGRGNWMATGLRRDFKIPEQLASLTPEGVAQGNSAAVLSLGDDEAGLPFHSHGSAWLAVVFGAKRWFIYEPGTMPAPVRRSFNPLASTATWARQHWNSSLLGSGLIVCDQQPGELLYLPERWTHATMNLGETVAVGAQVPGFDAGRWIAASRETLSRAEARSPPAPPPPSQLKQPLS